MLDSLFSCFRGSKDGQPSSEHGAAAYMGVEKASAFSAEALSQPASSLLNPVKTTLHTCSSSSLSELAVGSPGKERGAQGARCTSGPSNLTSSRPSVPFRTSIQDDISGQLNQLQSAKTVSHDGRRSVGVPVTETPLMREEYLKPSSDRAASTPTEPSIVGRLPTPAMLLSLRTHGFVTTDGWGPSGVGAASPSIFTNGGDSPTAGDGRPYSIDFMAMGLGDLGNSASESASGPVSICGLQPQLRFSTAGQLAHEVAALHLLGR